jgi:hypothetical protein
MLLFDKCVYSSFQNIWGLVMLLKDLFHSLAGYWLVLLTFSAVAYLLKNKYNRGLNRFPGPNLASYTNWWRFYDVFSRHAERTQIQLHKELGDVVRLGPNMLSFADPRALKVIYGLNKGFIKVLYRRGHPFFSI